MADYIYIVQSGVILPDTAVVLGQVQAEYKLVFSANLNVAPTTPQGMLINLETLGRVAVLANNAQLANQINPNEAGGVFLDAASGSFRAIESLGDPFDGICSAANETIAIVSFIIRAICRPEFNETLPDLPIFIYFCLG